MLRRAPRIMYETERADGAAVHREAGLVPSDGLGHSGEDRGPSMPAIAASAPWEAPTTVRGFRIVTGGSPLTTRAGRRRSPRLHGAAFGAELLLTDRDRRGAAAGHYTVHLIAYSLWRFAVKHPIYS
ncbi:hypothetical protein Acsp04_43600 [Actinomadura sp. NBRC 104425]|nr:hypothetical protein Acsp04_43600 [Actinomadura sp. NBRC 104425]